MSKKILIEVDIDDSGAAKGLEKVESGVEGIGKASKKSKKGVKTFGETLKNVGKSAGIIGLIAGAFELIKKAISGNQKLMDGINTAFTAFNIVVNDVVDVVTDMYTAVTESSKGFKALGKVMSGLTNLALTPLKLEFYAIKLALQEAQLIWEESMFGSKDTETIKALNASIIETKDNIIEVAKKAKQSAIDIKDNLAEAINEVGNAAGAASDVAVKAYDDFSIADKLATASRIENSKKLMSQLENQQTRIREQADRDAELQRQIRDDDTKSIGDRMKANEALFAILEKQQIDETDNVNKRIASLQLEQAQLGFNQERADEIYALETERFAIEAQQAGFISEQQTNKNALLREEKENLLELRQIGLEDSEREILEAEAEAERLALLAEQTIVDKQALADALVLIESDKQNKIDAINREAAKNDKVLAAKKKADEKKAADEALALEQAKQAGKVAVAAGAINLIAALAEEGSDLAKAAAIAQAVIDGYKGAVGGFSQAMSTYPAPFGAIVGALSVAAMAAMTIANIKKITAVKTKPTKGSGGNASYSPVSAPSVSVPSNTTDAPDFAIGGDDGQSQLADTVGNANSAPQRNYVLSSDIKNSEAFDRQTQNGASFGSE